jgi:hypothetical protein
MPRYADFHVGYVRRQRRNRTDWRRGDRDVVLRPSRQAGGHAVGDVAFLA